MTAGASRVDSPKLSKCFSATSPSFSTCPFLAWTISGQLEVSISRTCKQWGWQARGFWLGPGFERAGAASSQAKAPAFGPSRARTTLTCSEVIGSSIGSSKSPSPARMVSLRSVVRHYVRIMGLIQLECGRSGYPFPLIALVI